MKLVYFKIAGRAEVSRLIAHIGDLKVEDEFVEFPAWKELKPTTPFGQLPVLELDDGSKLAQSYAIEQYLARLAGLVSSDPLVAAKCDEMWFFLEEIQTLWSATMRISDEEEKLAKRKELMEGAFHDKMLILEKMLGELKTEFLGGDKPSNADLRLYRDMSNFKTGVLDGVPTDIIDKYPATKAFRHKVASYAPIKAYYEASDVKWAPAYKPDN